MSHKTLRTDKQCLNCGHPVEERYCSHCGQENLELNDSVTHLVIHYLQDLFHYDGKLWHTLKALVTKPGLVAAEYMQGKRQSYLEPIRFYVFASTIFFLAFFFVIGEEVVTTEAHPADNFPKRLYNLEQEKTFLAGTPDTMHLVPLIQALKIKTGDTLSILADTSMLTLGGKVPDSLAAKEDKVGWLEEVLDGKLDARYEELQKENEGDEQKLSSALINEVVHQLPQLFFLSLPFFAFFLKMLYWRSRRSSYVEHFIFAIYHYAYMYVFMLLYILVSSALDKLGATDTSGIEEWLGLGFFFYPVIYLPLSMKRFYNDRWGKLLFRYVILLSLLMVTMLALFVLVAVIAFLF